jgi:hypothetical protein
MLLPRAAADTRRRVAISAFERLGGLPVVIRWHLAASAGLVGVASMDTTIRKPTSWERAQVDVSKPQEVVGWCNKWKVTPERLKAAVAEVGTSAVSVEKALGRSG